MKAIIWILIILVVLCLIVLFCLLPGSKSRCVKHDWLFNALIAHRGIHDNKKTFENTAVAFNDAIEHKFNIETDVILTKDNKLVVFHDDNLKRLFNIDKKIEELTLQEIKELTFENGDKILEFSEFLELVDCKTGILIELKSQNNKIRNEFLCMKFIEAIKDYKGNYAVQSFDPFIMRYFKKKYPLIPRGQLYSHIDLKKETKNKIGKFFYNLKFANIISRPHFIVQNYKEYGFLSSLCKVFMPVIVFTIKDTFYYNFYLKKANNMIFESLEVDGYGRIKKSVS